MWSLRETNSQACAPGGEGVGVDQARLEHSQAVSNGSAPLGACQQGVLDVPGAEILDHALHDVLRQVLPCFAPGRVRMQACLYSQQAEKLRQANTVVQDLRPACAMCARCQREDRPASRASALHDICSYHVLKRLDRLCLMQQLFMGHRAAV